MCVNVLQAAVDAAMEHMGKSRWCPPPVPMMLPRLYTSSSRASLRSFLPPLNSQQHAQCG